MLSPEGVPSPSTLQKTLLLVEDDGANREILGMLARRLGWRVVAAPDAESGFRLIALEGPSVILCDLHLPGASGVELTRRLRGLPEFDGIPVIVHTADTTFSEADAQLGGMDALLYKPVRLRDLQRVLQDLGL